MLFGVTGVLISTSIIAAGCWWLFPKFGFEGLSISEYLSIGTIFSSTDTVCTLQVLSQEETPLLYSLVFGEGVVNDATSVVLFNAVQKINADRINGLTAIHILLNFLYLFTTSTVLGVTAGLVTAYVLRGLSFGRYAFATLSFIAETFIFLYVGMDALDYKKWKVSALSTVMFLIAFGRAAFVFPLSILSNYMHRSGGESSKISGHHQMVIWWAGLMRGAVSIALAFKQFTHAGVTMDPTNATMITTTIVIVLFSTIPLTPYVDVLPLILWTITITKRMKRVIGFHHITTSGCGSCGLW
nr:sodium/hydrogen exchanger 4-like isoform X2 [Tanacetum cinerariifolium]